MSVIYFKGMITDDGKQLLIDYPEQLKADYHLLAGYAIEGEIRKQRSTRTVRQNAWLHSFLGDLAKHLGYTLEELKLVGLVALWGTHDVMGFVLPVKPRTSKLNTEEFSDLCEWFVQKAAEVDFLVLYPEEFKRQKKQVRRGAADDSRRSNGVHAIGRIEDREGACASSAAPAHGGSNG